MSAEQLTDAVPYAMAGGALFGLFLFLLSAWGGE